MLVLLVNFILFARLLILYYRNPQTAEFCDKFGLTNFNKLLYENNNDSNGIPYYEKLTNTGGGAGGAEEIDLGDLDDDNDDVSIIEVEPILIKPFLVW